MHVLCSIVGEEQTPAGSTVHGLWDPHTETVSNSPTMWRAFLVGLFRKSEEDAIPFFNPLFVHQNKLLTSSVFQELLDFPFVMSEERCCADLLKWFIRETTTAGTIIVWLALWRMSTSVLAWPTHVKCSDVLSDKSLIILYGWCLPYLSFFLFVYSALQDFEICRARGAPPKTCMNELWTILQWIVVLNLQTRMNCEPTWMNCGPYYNE